MEDLSAFSAKPRLRLLLDHFSKIKDRRQAWKVAYPLCEVLFLVVVRDDRKRRRLRRYRRLGRGASVFLRGFAEFHYGIPCADRLRTVMNRIDLDLLMACFSSWVAGRQGDEALD
jgi:hypothetical protein